MTNGQASMLARMRDAEPAIEISDADLIGSFTVEERFEFASLRACRPDCHCWNCRPELYPAVLEVSNGY